MRFIDATMTVRRAFASVVRRVLDLPRLRRPQACVGAGKGSYDERH
jgi:hypothetical protein